MADKISPAQKSVPRKDGFKSGGDHTCISTPTDNEAHIWNKNVEQILGLFSKDVGKGK